MKLKYVDAFLDVAERFAKLSSAKRAQVGSIIVKDNRIISIGYNGMPSGWDNRCEDEYQYEDGGYEMRTRPEVLHAEANAIAKVAQSNESSTDAVLFCTHEPCIECAKLIHQAGISKVYYSKKYDAAKGTGSEFLEKSSIETFYIQKDQT